MSQYYHVIQGEFKVSDQADTVISTLLGSCVAACLFDPRVGVGGLNHFLLPGGGGNTFDSLKYGVHSMELLINSVMRMGARRNRLQAKLFGGARMSGNFSDIGAKNVAFAEQFLDTEDIPCVNKSVGGAYARKLRFYPATGRVQVKMVDRSMVVEQSTTTTAARPGNDLTIF